MSGPSEFPLHKAVSSKAAAEKEITELLASGIPVDQKNEAGETALHVTATIGRRWELALLLEKGANIAETDNDKNTALHRAVFNGHVGIVERLSRDSASLHAKNIYGFTPLFLAVRAAQWQEKDKDAIVTLLLKAGSDPLAETCAGLTPVQEAMDTSQYDLVKAMDGFGGPYVVTPSSYTEMCTMSKDRQIVDRWGSISSGTSRTLWDRERRLGNMKTFMNLANDIMCCLTSGFETNAPRAKGSHLLGEDLYRNLVLLFKAYVRDISAACKSLEQKDVLPFYFNEWKRYTAAIKSLNNQYSYLNRHWIKREQSEGHNLYSISEIATVVWKTDLVDRDARLLLMLEASLAGPHQETVETAMKALFVPSGDVNVEPSAQMGLMSFFEQQKSLWRTRAFDLKRQEQADFVDGVAHSLGIDSPSPDRSGELWRLTFLFDADTLLAYRAALLQILLLDNLWNIRAFKYDPEPRSGNRLKKLQRLLAQVPNNNNENNNENNDTETGTQILRDIILRTCSGSRDGIFTCINHLVSEYKDHETKTPTPPLNLKNSSIKWSDLDTTRTGRHVRKFLAVLQDTFASNDDEIVASAKNAVRECDAHMKKLCIDAGGDVTEMARDESVTVYASGGDATATATEMTLPVRSSRYGEGYEYSDDEIWDSNV